MVDFKELKARFNIEQVADLLGIPLKRSGDALRGPCPACDSGGERAVVVTPAKSVFYCFAGKEGGDILSLVAHIRKCDVKEAARWLDGSQESRPQPTATGNPGLKPLDLEHDHPAVVALGFEPEDAHQLGIGFAARGIMKGLVAIPIRLPTGELAGYVGVEEIAKLPPRWHGITTNVVALPKRA